MIYPQVYCQGPERGTQVIIQHLSKEIQGVVKIVRDPSAIYEMEKMHLDLKFQFQISFTVN